MLRSIARRQQRLVLWILAERLGISHGQLSKRLPHLRRTAQRRGQIFGACSVSVTDRSSVMGSYTRHCVVRRQLGETPKSKDMKCRGSVLYPTDSWRVTASALGCLGRNLEHFLGALSSETRLSRTGRLPKDCHLENERLQTMIGRREPLHNVSCWAVALSLGMAW